MAADFGIDLSCFPDLDPSGGMVSGQTCLAQALARRLTTPHGSVAYDPNYGTDIRAYLHSGMTDSGLQRVRSAVEAECELDERVKSAAATVSINAAARTMKVAVVIDTADGPFTLTLATSPASVAQLTVS